MRRFRSTNSFISPRRKDRARYLRIHSSADNQEALRNRRSGDFSSDVEVVGSRSRNLGRSARVKEAGQVEPVDVGMIDLIMDFRFSLKISSLPVYGGMILDHHIWPVGYRSSWHDKVSRSLFVCDVVDGGSSGPIFKVRQCPCYASSYNRQILGKSEAESKSGMVIFSDLPEHRHAVLLTDPYPTEQHLLSCIAVSTLGESYSATKD